MVCVYVCILLPAPPSLLQNFADSRIRVKGRFVKKEDEAILFEMSGLAGDPNAPAPPESAAGSMMPTPPPPIPPTQPTTEIDPDEDLNLESLFPDPPDEDEDLGAAAAAVMAPAVMGYASLPPITTQPMMKVVGVPLSSAQSTTTTTTTAVTTNKNAYMHLA